MRNLDGRSIPVGVLIGVAAAVSVGAASIPPSSPKCPWRLEMSRITAEVWRLNTGTGQLEACMVGLGGELRNLLTSAQCMPMPAPAALGNTAPTVAQGDLPEGTIVEQGGVRYRRTNGAWVAVH